MKMIASVEEECSYHWRITTKTNEDEDDRVMHKRFNHEKHDLGKLIFFLEIVN
jgi:hypothetical protein